MGRAATSEDCIVRATYFLIIAEIASYAILLSYSSIPLSYLGFSTSGFLQGQVWTLVTSMFVHVDLFHLAFNLFFLYVFGIAVEDRVGWKKTTAIFFAAGVLSLLIGIPFYSPDTRIVGASIAVSAIVGAAMVLAPGRQAPMLLFAPLGLVALIYLIFNAFMITIGETGGVAYESHVIGFIIGVIFGLAERRSFLRAFREGRGSGSPGFIRLFLSLD
jgi:membrane associated rhomboid family serine protease